MNEIEKYDWAGNNSESWVSSAENLLLSGHLLNWAAGQYEKVDPEKGKAVSTCSTSAKFLLLGYSLECFFKAVWRMMDPKNKLAENGKYIGPKTHDLNKLAHLAGFSFTDEEKTVLERLTNIVLSTGRYPIATHWEITKTKKILNVTSAPTWWWHGKDDKRFEGIIKKIREEIEKLKPTPQA